MVSLDHFSTMSVSRGLKITDVQDLALKGAAASGPEAASQESLETTIVKETIVKECDYYQRFLHNQGLTFEPFCTLAPHLHWIRPKAHRVQLPISHSG